MFGPIPVPDKWNLVYGLIDEIICEEIEYPNGYIGEVFSSNIKPELECFTPDELSVISTIATRFEKCNSTQISEISHQESAWINYKDKNVHIPFSEAFNLKAVE